VKRLRSYLLTLSTSAVASGDDDHRRRAADTDGRIDFGTVWQKIRPAKMGRVLCVNAEVLERSVRCRRSGLS
jgi:hypothetical protein